MSVPSYNDIQRTLGATEPALDASEVHGMVCGVLASGSEGAEAHLWAELFEQAPEGDLLARDARRSVKALLDYTRETIVGPGLGFSLLLPGDQRPMRERVAAVRSWAQGFMFGFGLGSVPAGALSADIDELLRDFDEISRLDAEVMAPGEDNEEAYTEIVEFLWVGTMLIYAQLEHLRSSKGT